MPSVSELIANGRTVEQIEELIGADRLIYLDLHGLIRSVRHDNSDITSFDTSCFSGEYVTEDVTVDYLRGLEKARSDKAKSTRRDNLNMPDIGFSEEAADQGSAVGM
jgi:amidophosphoribosyltransferase